jgi:hypothetical protein
MEEMMTEEEKILHRYRTKVARIRGGIVDQVVPLHNATAESVKGIQALITTAREEGRKEGLEQAARIGRAIRDLS